MRNISQIHHKYGKYLLDKKKINQYRVVSEFTGQQLNMGLLNSGDDKQLLLYRKWLNANKSRTDKTQLVRNIALSSSEEWILIKTDESLALLSAESKIGQQLWESLKEFSGKGKALIIYPEKGKLGFDLDFHESKTAIYEWTDDGLMIGKKQETQNTGISKINWKEAQIALKPSQGRGKKVDSTSKEKEPSEELLGIQQTTNEEDKKLYELLQDE